MSVEMEAIEASIDGAWPTMCQKYGINDGYVENLIADEKLRDFLTSVGWEESEWPLAIKSSIITYTTCLDKKTFDVLNSVSSASFIMGTICFANNCCDDEALLENDELLKRVYLTTLIAFMAGTEGSNDPEAMVRRFLNEIPNSEELETALQNIEWDVKIHDHTQELIESLQTAVAKHTLH